MNIDTNYQIKLIGYCSIGKDLILKKFIQEEPSSLTDLKGEYVIVVENNDECYIITSPYGVCQYYYTIHKNELFHNDTVIGVLGKSRLPWSWNWKALADLTQLDHVLENDTLHPQIHRVPAGSILHFRHGVLKTSSTTWEELNPSFPADPGMALAAFNNDIRLWIDDNVTLSLSGGFDSRAILSSLLKYDCRPLILTMGFDNSTDVIISRQITSALNLPLLVITLNPEDYLRHGSAITALTNGTTTTCNWHTYIYIQKAKLNPGCIFFIGANGEFARCRYLDKGIVSIIADMVAPLSLPAFWKHWLESAFKEEELNSLRPEFANELTKNARDVRLRKIMTLCHNKLLSGLDRFFLEQFVKNFIGDGLKLCSANVSWRAPFLNQKWVSIIWNLKRNWKLCSNWHRFSIAQNYPQLLNFPEIGRADKMYPKAPLLYWIPKRRHVVHYHKCQEWFQSDMIVDFILKNTSILSELIEKNTVISIVKEHKREGNRTYAIAFLLTMIFWLQNLKEVYNKKR